MNKIKNFVKNHKREIVIGCFGAAAVGVLAYVGLRKPKIGDDVIEFAKAVDKCCKDNTVYLYLPTEDVEKLVNNGCRVVEDASGQLIDVTKVIAFGNIVEET